MTFGFKFCFWFLVRWKPRNYDENPWGISGDTEWCGLDKRWGMLWSGSDSAHKVRLEELLFYLHHPGVTACLALLLPGAPIPDTGVWAMPEQYRIYLEWVPHLDRYHGCLMIPPFTMGQLTIMQVVSPWTKTALRIKRSGNVLWGPN